MRYSLRLRDCVVAKPKDIGAQLKERVSALFFLAAGFIHVFEIGRESTHDERPKIPTSLGDVSKPQQRCTL